MIGLLSRFMINYEPMCIRGVSTFRTMLLTEQRLIVKRFLCLLLFMAPQQFLRSSWISAATISNVSTKADMPYLALGRTSKMEKDGKFL